MGSTTRIIPNRLVDNDHRSNNTALLFSGGLDSTYTLFSNMALGPIPIMLLGTADIPISNAVFQAALEREYARFAKREGVPLTFVRSNAQDILDKRRVSHLFWKFQGRLLQGDHWLGIGYSLGHIGQVAPLSIGRFDQLLVSGALDWVRAHDERTMVQYPDASYPGTDEKIMWARMRVNHRADIPRHRKAVALRESPGARRFTLRPCTRASDHYSQARQSPRVETLNCNQCPKCLRTIAEIALAGIDPGDCGFTADRSTFERTRALLQGKVPRQDIALWWKPLQNDIPDEIEFDHHGSRQFLEWLKTANLESFVRCRESPLSIIYNMTPYPIANVLRLARDRVALSSARPSGR